MKNKSFSKSSSFKKSSPAKALLVAAMLSAFSTNAFAIFGVGDVVWDPAHMASTFGQAGKQLLEAKAQLDKLKEQYENMQKQLIKLQGLGNATMAIDDKFEERDPNYGMSAACPGAGSMSISSLMSSFSLDMSGDIKEQQKQLCQRIVLAQNKKYNESVKVLKLVRERNKELEKIAKRRADVGDEPGALNAVNNDIAKLQAQTSVDTQYANAVISAYDTYIQSLQNNQVLLTNQALTGNTGDETFASTLTRKFVQGAVLEGSLQALRTRRR
jgi:hypothetical protein